LPRWYERRSSWGRWLPTGRLSTPADSRGALRTAAAAVAETAAQGLTRPSANASTAMIPAAIVPRALSSPARRRRRCRGGRAQRWEQNRIPAIQLAQLGGRGVAERSCQGSCVRQDGGLLSSEEYEAPAAAKAANPLPHTLPHARRPPSACATPRDQLAGVPTLREKPLPNTKERRQQDKAPENRARHRRPCPGQLPKWRLRDETVPRIYANNAADTHTAKPVPKADGFDRSGTVAVLNHPRNNPPEAQMEMLSSTGSGSVSTSEQTTDVATEYSAARVQMRAPATGIRSIPGV